jgi:Glycosyltransferase family 87
VNESGSRPPSQSFRELLMGLLPFLLGIDLIFWVVFIPVGLRGDADFAMFYTAGSMVRSGSASQLYDYEVETRFQHELVSKTPAPYTHLPYEAAAFAALSPLDYRAAYWVFLAMNVVFAGLTLLMLQRKGTGWLFIAVLAAFFPLSAAIADGQDSIVLLMIAAGACWLLSRKGEFSAGALLALGLFRFQLVLPIAVLMFIWKRWRFVVGFSISSVLMLALSGAVGGFQQLNVYTMRLLSLGGVAGSEAGYAISTGQLRRMVSLRALFANLVAGGRLAQILTLVLSFVLLIWAGRQGRRLSARLQFAFAVGVSVLVSYHLFVYDLALLLISMSAVLELALKTDSRNAQVAALIPLIAVPLGVLWRPFLLALPLLVFLIMLKRALREPDHHKTDFSQPLKVEDEQLVSPA